MQQSEPIPICDELERNKDKCLLLRRERSVFTALRNHQFDQLYTALIAAMATKMGKPGLTEEEVFKTFTRLLRKCETVGIEPRAKLLIPVVVDIIERLNVMSEHKKKLEANPSSTSRRLSEQEQLNLYAMAVIDVAFVRDYLGAKNRSWV